MIEPVSGTTGLHTGGQIFLALIVAATLAGCGKSATGAASANAKDNLCKAALGTGLTKKCSFNDLGSTVGIVIDTDDDQKARTLCADIAGKMRPATAGLSDKWKLQVFSPYRDDKPLAACYLH
ncbi:MAG: hypothetical protein WBQ69_10335 [Gallionella sp.]